MIEKRKGKRIISLLLLACLLACALFVSQGPLGEAASKDTFLSWYRQTVYNQEDGLGSTKVNCITQTRSGYIWVGTDGGLYRYNGKEFKSYNLWNTEKDDVYYVNELYQDSEDRLWVATNNYGLFCLKGSEVVHFSTEYYDGVKCINDVCQSADGIIYVATMYGLYIVDQESESLIRVKGLEGKNIKAITTAGDYLWGIESMNSFFRIGKDHALESFPAQDFTTDELSCILGMEDGTIYLGTMGTEILHLKKDMKYESLISGKDGVNSLFHDGERLFVCADGGIGYLNKKGAFTSLNEASINKYISDMIMDYEGNYWIVSNRQGILFLGRSKFQNFNERYGLTKAGTNCIVAGKDGMKYIGTDEGIQIVDSRNALVTNTLSEYLMGASVKHIMIDSKGYVWVSTSRRYGIVRYSPKEKIEVFGRTGNLLTNQVNCTLELKDGRVAVATEEGISIIDRKDTVVRSYSARDGMKNANIICMYQADDGKLYAGSDGGGLYVIENDTVQEFTEEDGLTSNVVSRIVPGKEGLWIGTDNGLSLYTESIRPISNIDFSNNIYDILPEKTEEGDRLWIVGSKGVLCTTEEELLGTEGISSRYYAQGDGLGSALTLNSRDYIDNNILYLCSERGVYMINTQNIVKNEVAPKLTVSEINVDDTVYHYDQLGGSLTVPSGTQRISIAFSVLSYTNRENIQVEYMLEGFDNAPITISPLDPMQAVYTNLEGGTYTFTVRAMNGDGVASEQDVTFIIKKEYGFFEKRSVRIGLLVLLAMIILLVVLYMVRFQKRVLGQNKEIEKLEKEHEVAVKSSTAKTDFLAHMSNEIKTPVNAIISLAESLQREPDEENRNRSLSVIVESGQDILGKVDETIQLARLEAGKEAVAEAPYSITTLVCDISDQMINVLDGRPVRFLVDLGENIPDVMIGDYEKVKRILEILLDNAQKYTQEGTITLFVDCYDDADAKRSVKLMFSISDTGVGIQKDRLQHIFEVYNIADNKKQTGYSGSGISLAIAKKLTEIMNGELEVESTYGAGSAFTLNLPQMRPESDVVPAAGPEAVERVTREEAEKMLVPDINVLLVDDIEISRTVAVGVLKQMEIRCDVAASGVSAIDMVMNQDYDLIFMDLSMPVMNGTDAMKEIRELVREGVDSVPIIAMTEDAIREDSDQLQEAGFDDVIVKPLDIVTLATMIIKFLPTDLIHYKSGDLNLYMNESRYREGLEHLQLHLDVAGTLERIGGSIEVYNRILSTFYNQNQNSPEELQVKFSKNYRTFRTRIHNIRTGAQNIGAVELVNHISRIDSAINIGNKNYVRDNLPSLLDMLNTILDAIAVYLEFAATQTGVTDEEYAARAAEKTAERIEEKKEAPVSAETPSEPEAASVVEERAAQEEAQKEAQKEAEQKEATKKEENAAPENIREQVDFEALKRMVSAAKKNDIILIEKELKKIRKDQYGTEDSEFLQALSEQLQQKNMEAILDMIGTYIELKT
ncbi:MAG: response regulator [Eubacterium sp.]|nr:response regulator [Eubacterium sp.]